MSDLWFTLLGPFTVCRDGVDVTPASPERRAVLAALVLERGRVVSVDDLASALRLDGSADPLVTLRPHVDALAALLDPDRAGPRLLTTDDGWRLDLPDPASDLDEATSLDRSAALHLMRGQQREAARDLQTATRLWRGRSLDGLAGGWFDARRTALDDLLDRLVADLARVVASRPTPEVAAYLQVLSRRYPLHPVVWWHRIQVEETVHGVVPSRELYWEARRVLGDREMRPAWQPRDEPGPDRGADDSLRTLVTLARAGRRTRPVGAALPDAVLAALGLPVPAVDEVRFEVLVRPETVVGDRAVPLVPDGTQALLGVLLLSGGGPLVAADLVARAGTGALDDEDVRAAFDRLGARARDLAGREVLTVLRTSRGWELPQVPGRLDLEGARTLVAAATGALAAHRTHLAAPALRHVLDRVPAEPFAALRGPWFAARRTEIVLWRTRVEAECLRAERAQAVALAAVESTANAVRGDPLREDHWAEHLQALVRAGLSEEALHAYADVEGRLHLALRTAPGPTLQMLKARIEADDPTLYLP